MTAVGLISDLASTIPPIDARKELKYNRKVFDFIVPSRKRAPALLLAIVISPDSKSLRIPSRSRRGKCANIMQLF